MRFTCHNIKLCTSLMSKNNCYKSWRSYSSAISSEKNEDILTEHNICFKSCGTLYDKWRKEKRFRTIPDGPLTFKINYYDTRINCSNALTSPVVVALHGAPGSCTDFKALTLYLHNKGARVVIPSFPDFTAYKPGIFRHSAEEKAQFVKDFLSAKSIKEIDALVIHSSAVYPGLLLCLSQDPVIKSIIMLNPGTCSLDMKTTKYIKVMEKVAKICEVPIFLKLLEIMGPSLCKVIKLPVRVENILDPLLSATCMVHGNITESKENFLQLAKKEFPMLYMFSNDDKLIGKECSYELAHFLGANDEGIYIYDKNGNLIQNGNERRNLKVMSFEDGSHYVFWRHSHTVFEAVADFIVKLRSPGSLKTC